MTDQKLNARNKLRLMKYIFLQFQNDHFEVMVAWLQILQIPGNSTIFYVHSPRSIFIWNSKFTIGFWIIGKVWVKSPCMPNFCATSFKMYVRLHFLIPQETFWNKGSLNNVAKNRGEGVNESPWWVMWQRVDDL